MRLLLDTHALLWWLAGDPSLTKAACDAIADEANAVFVSAATAWEISIKHHLGKLPGATALVADISEAILSQGFAELPISVRHAQAAGALPGTHRDPFDRMLIAQTNLETMTLVSMDRIFDRYGVHRLW